MNDHGFVVCAFNRSPEKVKDFLENGAKGTQVCKQPNQNYIQIFMSYFDNNMNLFDPVKIIRNLEEFQNEYSNNFWSKWFR